MNVRQAGAAITPVFCVPVFGKDLEPATYFVLWRSIYFLYSCLCCENSWAHRVWTAGVLAIVFFFFGLNYCKIFYSVTIKKKVFFFYLGHAFIKIVLGAPDGLIIYLDIHLT